MRTRSHIKPRISVVTLGCSKNVVDSEVLTGQLQAGNFRVTHDDEVRGEEVVIINTCGFIDRAKEESVQAILSAAQAKKEGRVGRLYVTGCLSERYRDDLAREIPEVDAFFGTHELPVLLRTLGADYKHELVGERLPATPAHYAYLKISEGCNKSCSFCAIPLMRGKHVSKSLEELEKEARLLASRGVRELMLIAQDLTWYGMDLYREKKLAVLLEMLSQVNGIEWVRLHYIYPTAFPMEITELMNRHPQICKYLDMPLQHISDNILKAMRRGTGREATRSLIRTLREKVPGIALRTTLMVGFPGETEKEFDELCRFVEEMRFDRLGVFTYSHEENTFAHGYPDSVEPAVKERRAAELMRIQEGISLEINRQKTGKVLRVLFDRKEGGYFVGRTEHDSPEVDNEVWVPAGHHYLRAGDFASIRITDATEFDLYGEPAY